MGLTLYWDQKLKDAGLIEFFERNRATWLAAAREAYQYVKTSFPADSTIRRDDVSQFLVHVIEVDEDFKNYLDMNRLKQKYWAYHFADLVVDRTWNEITNQGNPA
jgi:hypothetical protein